MEIFLFLAPHPPPRPRGPKAPVWARFYYYYFHRLGPLGAWHRPRRGLTPEAMRPQDSKKRHSQAVKMHRTPDIGPPKSKNLPLKAFYRGPWSIFGHFLAPLTSVSWNNWHFDHLNRYRIGFCRGSSLPSSWDPDIATHQKIKE